MSLYAFVLFFKIRHMKIAHSITSIGESGPVSLTGEDGEESSVYETETEQSNSTRYIDTMKNP